MYVCVLCSLKVLKKVRRELQITWHCSYKHLSVTIWVWKWMQVLWNSSQSKCWAIYTTRDLLFCSFFLEVQMRLYFFQSSKCIIFIICVHICTTHMCTYKFPFHLKEIFGKRDWPSKLWWFFWFDFLKTDAFLMHYILITFYIYVLYLPTSLLLSQSRIIPPLSLIRK